jgi:hypothetical protein
MDTYTSTPGVNFKRVYFGISSVNVEICILYVGMNMLMEQKDKSIC